MRKNILAVVLFVVLFASIVYAGDVGVTSSSYNPAPANPGSSISVWVQIKNNSNYKAEDVIVEAKPEFPFLLQPGETAEKNLGNLDAFQTATIEYKFLVDSKATDGEKGLDIIVGEGFPLKKETVSINILSRTPKLEIVGSDTDKLSPGEVKDVQLTIKNIGGSIARNIVIKVNPDRTVTATGVVVERELVSLGAVSTYLDYLEQGAQAEVNLTLAVNQDVELKNYSIPVTMEYYDVNSTAKTETGYLGIRVTAEAEVDAVIGDISPKAYPGGTSEIAIDLFNIGIADARYVVVELSGTGMAFEEPRQFIGTLEADDFDSFKANVKFAPETALGETPLIVKVIYKDAELNEKVVVKAIAINVVNAAEAQGLSADPLLGIVGLISLALQLVGLYVVGKWAWPRVKAFKKKK